MVRSSQNASDNNTRVISVPLCCEVSMSPWRLLRGEYEDLEATGMLFYSMFNET